MWENRSIVCNKNGFTLPELLVTICLTSVLLSCFLTCFFIISDLHRNRSAMLELQDNLFLAIELLSEDIAKSTAVIDCANETLTLQQGEVIYYSLGQDQQFREHFYFLEGKVLYRRESMQKNRQPMANFIDTLEFYYLDQNGRTTENSEEVNAIHIFLTGKWMDRTIQIDQIIRLAGTLYL